MSETITTTEAPVVATEGRPTIELVGQASEGGCCGGGACGV